MHANKTDPNSDYKKRLSHRRMLNSENVLYVFLWSVLRSTFSLSSVTNPIALVSPYPWIACVNTPHAKYFSYDIHFRCHCWCCGCCCRLLFLNSVCFNLYVFCILLVIFPAMNELIVVEAGVPTSISVHSHTSIQFVMMCLCVYFVNNFVKWNTCECDVT